MPVAVKLSAEQLRVLRFGACFVHRGEVRTARSLERLGLGLLEDHGYMRCNSERWHFTPNDAGREAMKTALREVVYAPR